MADQLINATAQALHSTLEARPISPERVALGNDGQALATQQHGSVGGFGLDAHGDCLQGLDMARTVQPTTCRKDTGATSSLSQLLAQQLDLLAQLNASHASASPSIAAQTHPHERNLPALPSGLTHEQALAESYWSTRDFKVYAVTVLARQRYEPDWERTYFARARTPEGAIRATKAHMFESPPTTPQFTARLATPRQLGCVPS